MPNNASLFDRPPDTDWALGWLEYLFRSGKLPANLSDNGQHFVTITDALRQALGFYSLGLAVLAGIILLYHITILLTQSAQTGVALGRRSNQFWAPIRLVLAFSLLLPVGGGLNSGQYLVLKLAEAGSALASNAWNVAASSLRGNFSGLLPPRNPDVTRWVAAAVEMEICHNRYQRLYTSFITDPLVKSAGDMSELQKLTPPRLGQESWRYTNNLHPTLPLCGEYRFDAKTLPASLAGNNDIEFLANDLADYAHTSTEHLVFLARAQADQLVSIFPSTSISKEGDIHTALNDLIGEQQKSLNFKLRGLISNGNQHVDAAMDNSVQAGWITAASFITELARLQTVYGLLANSVLPTAQPPLFGHLVMSKQIMPESLQTDPMLSGQTPSQLIKLNLLYNEMNKETASARNWLYRQQIAKGEWVLADQFEVRDILTPYSDSGEGFFLYNRLLQGGAVSYGVWPAAAAPQDPPPIPSLFSANIIANPISALAEFGRRQVMLGAYLFSMAGIGLSTPDHAASGALFGILALLFLLAGFGLMAMVALLPFVRFFIAVLAWVLAVFEAVIMAPLVALAHINPTAEGLAGPHARQAYWRWLSLLLRPALILFGFISGLLVLLFAISLLNLIVLPLQQLTDIAHGELLALLRAGLVLLYAWLASLAAWVAFKGINLLPEIMLNWLQHIMVVEALQEPVAAQNSAQAGAAVNMAALLGLPGGGGGMGDSGKSKPTSAQQNQQNILSAERLTSSSEAAARPPTATELRSALFPTTINAETTALQAANLPNTQIGKESNGEAQTKTPSGTDKPNPVSGESKLAPSEKVPYAEILRAAQALDQLVRTHHPDAQDGATKKADDKKSIGPANLINPPQITGTIPKPDKIVPIPEDKEPK